MSFTGTPESTCEQLGDVRDKPSALLASSKAVVAAFRLERTRPLGTKRSGVRGAFIPSVTQAVEGFYSDVVQNLRPWAPPAPQLADGAADADPAEETSPGTGTADAAG